MEAIKRLVIFRCQMNGQVEISLKYNIIEMVVQVVILNFAVSILNLQSVNGSRSNAY